MHSGGCSPPACSKTTFPSRCRGRARAVSGGTVSSRSEADTRSGPDRASQRPTDQRRAVGASRGDTLRGRFQPETPIDAARSGRWGLASALPERGLQKQLPPKAWGRGPALRPTASISPGCAGGTDTLEVMQLVQLLDLLFSVYRPYLIPSTNELEV
ncbi:hypothetical protein chiPu_0012823 [Chiloscyllium punctatum]|uniref:Uncharacterized protein n=1 Tax=Chiloscyllium punctatum TaxID=137246 RepID=A0A401SVE5_CHIPU|nr:hypothetical protein [Chiloscyllium punctatum]